MIFLVHFLSGQDKMISTNRFLLFVCGFLISTATLTTAAFGQTGSIDGRVTSSETSKALPGASVFVLDTKLGGFTRPTGEFQIRRVPTGTYSVAVSYIGYQTDTINNVVVKDGESTSLNVVLDLSIATSGKVIVEARVQRNNENILLVDRRKAAEVSDGISSEGMEKSGSSDAGEAIEKVTGVSVTDGKYVAVRGLGDRYSGVTVNGSQMPSMDPNKKAVQLDMLPAGMLESIVASKTFTPDKPGDFTGGGVNVSTRSFPEKFSLKVSMGSSNNFQTSQGSDILAYSGSGTDWLGMDDGLREMPAILNDLEEGVPNRAEAFSNPDKAYLLNDISKSFNNVMVAGQETAPFAGDFGITLGTKADLSQDLMLGFISTVSYKRSFSGYDGGQTNRWKLTGDPSTIETLNNEVSLSDSKGSSEALLGGMANVTLGVLGHEIGLTGMYNQSGITSARYQQGSVPRDLAEDQVYQTRTLGYLERNIANGQLSGKHPISENIQFDWSSAMTSTTQDEPDLRFFTNHYKVVERNERIDTLYSISASTYNEPSRYFRTLEESLWDNHADLTYSFKQWEDQDASVKAGFAHAVSDRSFTERNFVYQNESGNGVTYRGDSEAYFGEGSVGIVDSTGGFYTLGNVIQDQSQLRNTYDADQAVTAGYAMLDLPLSKQWRIIAGARFEHTDISVISADTSVAEGSVVADDILPSINAVYSPTELMNFRAAYTHTLARPTFRELAPFASFEFVGDYIFIGNPELQRTEIKNIDLRWEYFVAPGELLAVSAFYKDFTNPIERVILNENGQVIYQNVESAELYGLELEARKKLSFISTDSDILKHMSIGANITLIDSRVQIGESELEIIRSYDPEAADHRPLQSQSPYLINADIAYNNYEGGLDISMTYNVFGERLSTVTLGGTPDVYEQPHGSLNLVVRKKFDNGMYVKLGAKNLIDSPIEFTQEFKGTEYIYQSYTKGTSISLGFGISFN